MHSISCNQCFGKALLAQLNRYKHLPLKPVLYVLLGAGTLRAGAYKPYHKNIIIDTTVNVATKFSASDSTVIQNATIDHTSQTEIKSGKTIRILPETVIKSNTHILIDPSLSPSL